MSDTDIRADQGGCPLCGYQAENQTDAIVHAMGEHPDECGYSDFTVQ